MSMTSLLELIPVIETIDKPFLLPVIDIPGITDNNIVLEEQKELTKDFLLGEIELPVEMLLNALKALGVKTVTFSLEADKPILTKIKTNESIPANI